MQRLSTWVIAAAIALAASCPARAVEYMWPPLWTLSDFTFTYPQYLQVNTLGTFSVLDKVVGGTYYGDHDNYNDPSADSDTVHGTWTFPSNTPLDSNGSELQTPVITRSNTLCSHTSVPTTFQCQWSTTGSKSVSVVLDDDGRFGQQSKDQVGAPSTRTQNMTVTVVSVDIDTDSNNDGIIDGTDDPIEMDAPGRIVEMGGRATVDLSYAPSTGVTNCRLKLYTISGPGEVTIWDSETGGSQIASGTMFSPTAMPSQVWVQGAALGETVLGLAFLPPAAYGDAEVCRDDVKFKVGPDDPTQPYGPVVIDDGEFTVSRTTLHATWSASDPESGILEYRYAIGTDPNQTNLNWQSVGTATELTRNDLTLVPATTYYFFVKAMNGAGDWSTGLSDGITCIADRVIFVKPAPGGSDSNSGYSWMDAKASVSSALGTAVLESRSEVWVAAGAYQENVNMPAGIKLYGAFAGNEDAWKEHRAWLANETILEGDQSGSVVTIASGATTTTVLEGFTVKNGLSQYNEGISCYTGAGVHCVNASPVISHNTITENQGPPYQGGSMLCIGGVPGLYNNKIVGNEGTGIWCSASSPVMVGNQISSQSQSYGACYGVYMCDCSGFTISGNIVTDNTGSYGGADGICCYSSGGRIADNVISGNTGHGIYLSYCENPLSISVINNTVTGNAGTGVCCNDAVALVANNIITNNDCGVDSCYYGLVEIHDNCINETWPYSGWYEDPEDDLLTDPILVGWHIQAESPCLDAGDNSVVQSGDMDIDGQARRQPTSISQVDIGADELSAADSGMPVPVITDELSFFSSLVNYSGN